MLTELPYASLVSTTLIGALIGFIAGLIAIIFLGKLNLLKRNNIWYNRFIKLYYLYVPLCFMLAVGTWMVGNAVKEAAVQRIETNRQQIIESSVELTRILWVEVETTFPNDKPVSVKDVIRILSYQYLKDHGVFDALNHEFIKKIPHAEWLVEQLTSRVATGFFLDKIEDMLLAYIGENKLVDKEVLHTFFTANLVEAMQEGLLVNLLKRPIDLALKPLFTMLQIMLCFAALPFLEIMLYRLLRKKQIKV